MTVVDASAITELLLATTAGARVAERLHRDRGQVHAPDLVDIEVLSALRRLEQRRDVPEHRADEAVRDLSILRIIRHRLGALVDRAWELRHNCTVQDAMYLALAEGLDATVVTCDARLGRAPGHAARVELIR